MSLVERYHADHVARLERLGSGAAEIVQVAPRKPDYKPVKPRAGLKPIDPEMYYRNMWFWDLLSAPVWIDGYRPTVKRIKQIVSRHYGVSITDIESARRTAEVVFPRQLVMYLARKLTLLSLPQIGQAIGQRDHTTVLHGCRKIDRHIKANPEFEFVIEKLQREMGAI